MTDTYLNGKIRLTSLAAPSADDLETISRLSASEREALALEVLEIGRNSPLSESSLDDGWEEALAEIRGRSTNRTNAL